MSSQDGAVFLLPGIPFALLMGRAPALVEAGEARGGAHGLFELQHPSSFAVKAQRAQLQVGDGFHLR